MTLTRIARTLGLSVTTVSRALGGFDDVAAQTRERVMAEAARIDYRPNRAARQLRSGQSGAIGLVLPTTAGRFDDPFFLRLLSAIGPRLTDAGLDLLVTAASPGEDELRAYRHMAQARRVDGFLVARMRRKDDRVSYLLDRGVPFVAHGRTEETRAYAHLDIDGAAACRAATERLIRFGHRRIAMINAAEIYMFAQIRQAGWQAALRDAGLPPGPLVHAEPNEENGFRLALSLLGAPQAPTALLCATDRLAVGALRAVASLKLQAGRDVSVIGYDNLPAATYTDPPLTTIEQPIERAGARMVEMMRALLDGASPAGLAEIWQARLIPRSSDGPAPDNTADTGGPQHNSSGGHHDLEAPPGG